MAQLTENSAVLDLVRACTEATDQKSLFHLALPMLRRLVGASVVVVEVAGPQGPEIAFRDGLEVRVGPVPVSPNGNRSVVLSPVDWRVLGIDHIISQHLAGHSGTLALGWPTAEDEYPHAAQLPTILDLVVLASARLNAETELRDLGARVDSAQHLATMGDYDWHIASDTNQWSDELYRIYGYEPKSFNPSYERFLANIHPDDRERIQGIHQQAYATGEPYRMIERIVRPDGELRYLSSNGEVIMDATGTPVRMRGTCIDITDRVLAEQERERVNARFRGLVEAAPEAILVIDTEEKIVQTNPRAAEILGADPTGLSLRTFLPTGPVSGQAVAALGAEERDLVLDVTTAPLSRTEQSEMTAIFLADAQPRLDREAMAIRLGESQQRRRQALEINDNVVQGLTSAAYALDQHDETAARSYVERTLNSARHMMDDLLEPRGQQIRPGDLVRAEAASLDARPAPAPVTAAEPVATDPTATRVLIVDDAEDIRMLLRLKLDRHGEYDVVGEAVDGLDAVELARELQPNLVLLDMAMPRMDGLQALPLIREAVPDVRVIVLSGFNQATLEREAIAAGADRYVVKGGSMRELLEVIANVLRAS